MAYAVNFLLKPRQIIRKEIIYILWFIFLWFTKNVGKNSIFKKDE